MKRCLACLVIFMLFNSVADIGILRGAMQILPKETPEDQKIKVQTELMEVRTVVTDREGRIVEGLGKDDFELLENDQPQEISFFSVSRVESQPGENSFPQSTGVPKGEIGQRPVQERLSALPVRTTLLYVDTLHLSFSSLNWVKQALRRFVKEKLTEQDTVALATSGQTLGIAQQFTRNRQILNHAIEQIRYSPTRVGGVFTPNLAADFLAGRLDAGRVALEIVRREQNIECPCSAVRGFARSKAIQVLSEDSYSRQNTLSTLTDFARQMINLPGKRMIVVFSDGFTMRDSAGNVYDSEVRSVINRAVRSGVVIYSIDAKGLTPPSSIDVGIAQLDLSNIPPEPTPDSDGTNPRCPNDPPDPACFSPPPGQLETYLNTFDREMLDGLYEMAAETGGRMFTDTNDLGGALSQAFDANRYYYVLSYYLPARGDSRQFRSITVRVRNHPEYKVRTARGFAMPDLTAETEAESAKTPQQRLIRAMSAPLPITDLGVSAQADFLEKETDDKQVSLSVYFDGDRFQYQQQDQRNLVDLELIYAVYDSSGKQVEGTSAQVEGTLSADRLAQAKTSGFRFSRRLTLKPGAYQVRVGVREEGTDRMGTATAWVEVPELAQDKLEMSSLILSNPLDIDADDREGIDVSELEQIKMVQGIPLFERGDFFDYSFRVHQAAQPLTKPDLQWLPELYREGKLVKEGHWQPVSVEKEDIDSKGWFDVYGEVDIGKIEAGVYELRVSVKDSQSDKTIQRAAVFSVEQSNATAQKP